eukprot:TRINITY_DN262_c0_g1_i2.p1 TRINITY_DN262_c0_g1~~TRINITY_DN262_c0_g1_i2.p1  ORF type:complete len:113 (-),score=27.37 TRINITY_DN262_c0_g1_i2:113-412(-)
MGGPLMEKLKQLKINVQLSHFKKEILEHNGYVSIRDANNKEVQTWADFGHNRNYHNRGKLVADLETKLKANDSKLMKSLEAAGIKVSDDAKSFVPEWAK